MNINIRTYIDSFKRKIIQDKILIIIDDFNTTELKNFIVKRISYSHNLERLLLKGIEESKIRNYNHIAIELQKNLDDEQGRVNGIINKDKAHLSWRNNFLEELGIQKLIQNHQKNYYDFCHLNYFELLGVIISIETMVPIEFGYIKKAILRNNIQLSERGMFYIDDHIIHDAKSHLPDLLYAVNKDIKKKVDIEDIIKGIQIGYESKTQFYSDINI